MKYRLISFDLDGTLVDTASEIVEAVNRALKIHGISPRSSAGITQLIGSGTKGLARKLLELSVAEHPDLLDRVSEPSLLASLDQQYMLVNGTSARPYSGCSEALASIKSAGLRMACVTNKELKHAQRLLRATELDSWFELVIGGDSLAERKPHPSVLRHVAQALGTDVTHCVHLGDSAIDVEAARSAGFAAWAVTYGYNAGVPIASAAPDVLFDNLPEVAERIRTSSSP